MQRWRGIENTPADWGRSVITIGVFDGVHKGHQAVIGEVAKVAAEQGSRSVVVTFDPHPSEVVRPGSHPAVLTSANRKADLIESLGVDGLCVIPFTVATSQQTAEEFVHETLVSMLHAATIVVGENFRFGNKARGDVVLLRELGERFGFTVHSYDLQHADTTTTYSSTYIRALIAAGEVGLAAHALGRAHRIDGLVVRGDQRGRQMGFPTANVRTTEHAAIPADGVYAGWLLRRGARLPAAISLGSNPTFAGTEHRVEAYILDFDGDLYGEDVGLEFVTRLRSMERFDSVEELVAQIDADVAATRVALR